MLSIELDGWNLGIKFAACHVIPRHEKCGRLHGHTYAIHARLHGEPNEDGILFDFGDAKASLKKIADALDHSMLVPTKNRFMKVKERNEVEVRIEEKRYVVPRSDCVMLPIKGTTAEELAYWVLGRFLDDCRMPPNVKEVEIGVDESIGQGAWVKKKLK